MTGAMPNPPRVPRDRRVISGCRSGSRKACSNRRRIPRQQSPYTPCMGRGVILLANRAKPPEVQAQSIAPMLGQRVDH